MSKKVDPRIRKMNDAQVSCHELMHSWDRTNANGGGRLTVHLRVGKTIKEVKRELTCLFCHTKRIDIYSGPPQLELLRRTYVYPPGYLAHNAGQPSLTRADYRYVSYIRAKVAGQLDETLTGNGEAAETESGQ